MNLSDSLLILLIFPEYRLFLFKFEGLLIFKSKFKFKPKPTIISLVVEKSFNIRRIAGFIISVLDDIFIFIFIPVNAAVQFDN